MSLKNAPFHIGEQKIQERYGVADRMKEVGGRVIRTFMPDQHRIFYNQLPFMVIGALDDRNRPWASMLWGKPGFVTSPDTTSLQINSMPVNGDPLRQAIRPGTRLGMLGIEPHTRRRNRVNGVVGAVSPGSFSLDVKESFGNCPKYIQARGLEWNESAPAIEEERRVNRHHGLTSEMQKIINHADTFYIASSYDRQDGGGYGVDASHRGGKPGFVEVLSDKELLWPDYSGNFFFNTLGNILLNPRSGYLFPVFETGQLLFLTGESEIMFNPNVVDFSAGAERMIRFRVEEAVLVDEALPFKWTFFEYSPFLSFPPQEQPKKTTGRRELVVERVEQESDRIKSFYLISKDGEPLPCFEPGQFLTLRLPGGDGKTMVRTYTLSDHPRKSRYRISVKREASPKERPDLGPGKISNFLHDHVKAGDVFETLTPRGKFVLDKHSHRPVMLVSAGVGITPMMSMLHMLARKGKRPVWFVHGARDSVSHAFAEEVRETASLGENVRVHFRYSNPGRDDKPGRDFDSVGRVDVDLLAELASLKDYEFYLCGPSSFMLDLTEGLKTRGVDPTRIRFESFGPASVKSTPSKKGASAEVVFARSGKSVTWKEDGPSILELAEDGGIEPAFSCRSGSCGSCSYKLVEGKVRHPDGAVNQNGEVLLCCAKPEGRVVIEV